MKIMLPFLLFLALATADLRVDFFKGAAIGGKPATSSTVDSLQIALHNFSGSAELSGLLNLPPGAASYYAFDCSFDGGQIAYVWIDDHLICHTDPIPFGNTPSSTDGSIENPLVGSASAHARVVLVHVSSASTDGSGAITSGPTASVSVRWARLAAPLAVGSKPQFEAIPSSLLGPTSPPLEQRRRALQDGLKQGWNLWGYNLIGLVRLPDSSVLTTALCKLSTASCLTATRIEDTKAAVRVGPFAIDQSYWQLYIGFEGVNISISVAGGGKQLHVLVEPLNCASPAPADAAAASTSTATSTATSSTANCSDYQLVLLPRYQWFRPGGVSISADGSIEFSPMGHAANVVQPTATPVAIMRYPGSRMPTWSSAGGAGGAGATGADVDAEVGANADEDDEIARAGAKVSFSLAHGAVGFREGEGEAPDIDEVRSVVAAARSAELSRYAAYGALGEVKEALQAATMWNYVVSPAEYGPFLPVSRSWNFVKKAASTDWNYVIFDCKRIVPTALIQAQGSW